MLFRRTVPTAAMRIGDFSDYQNVATGAIVPIYDPWTQCGINNPGSGAYNGDCGVVPGPGCNSPAMSSRRTGSVRYAQKLLAFPIYADPTVPGRWVPGRLRAEHLDRWRQRSIQLPRRLQPESEPAPDRARHPLGVKPTCPVDTYGNGQTNGNPYRRHSSRPR